MHKLLELQCNKARITDKVRLLGINDPNKRGFGRWGNDSFFATYLTHFDSTTPHLAIFLLSMLKKL